MFKRGDTVTVGRGTSKYRVVRIEAREDTAGEPYAMAILSTDKGKELMEETSRLHKVLEGKKS